MANNNIQIKKLSNGMKGINFEAFGGLENFLMQTSTGAAGLGSTQIVRRVNPWLAKATDMTGIAVSELPFEIQDENGKMYDTSSDWKNKLGGMPCPQDLLYLLASSLCMGKAYVIPRYLSSSIVDLHFCAPHTVAYTIIPTGLDQFSRTSDYGQAGMYKPAPYDKPDILDGEMMYFWLPDPDIEIGAPKTFPAGTALLNSQLITGMSGTLKATSEAGFIPPTILAAKGMVSPEERNKTETWWNGFLRRWNENVAKLINAEAMSIVKVGAGMEELKGIYTELSKEQKESIGAAYGIPGALFMSDMAFASEVNEMVKMWYSSSQFVKIYRCIETTFNTQLLYRFGKKLKFKPDTLDAFQEAESKRAISFFQYSRSGIKRSVAAQILGIKLPEGLDYEDLDKEPEPVYSMPKGQATAKPETNTEEKEPVSLTADEAKSINLWRQVAVRNFKKGKGKAEDFKSSLPSHIENNIRSKLLKAATEEEVIKAFTIGEVRQPDGLFALAEAINKASEAMNEK